MRYYLIFGCLLSAMVTAGQGLVMGPQTSMNIGANSTLYLGADASLGGQVENNGTIVGTASVDFDANLETGDLTFTGTGQQILAGDSLVVNQITITNGGVLTLTAPWAVVQNNLSLTDGSLVADDDHRLILSDEISVDGEGFVSGQVYAVVGENPVMFPVGVGGAKGHLSISSATEGTVIRVACALPADSILIPAYDMIGISDELQWEISAVGQQITSGRVSFDLNRQDVSDFGVVAADFSGIDLQNFVQVNDIRANDYEPALIYYDEADSNFSIVQGSEVFNSDEISNGEITTTERLQLGALPLRIYVAMVPVLTAPTFFVPSAFAPNGTYEENHRFRPYFAGNNVTSVHFSVWDSYNVEVHSFQWQGEEIDLRATGWDGKYTNGVEAPSGMYFFSVDISAGESRYQKQGSVMLVK